MEIVGLASTIFGALLATLGILFAWHGYRNSVRAPILKVSLWNADGRSVDFPTQTNALGHIPLRVSEFMPPGKPLDNSARVSFRIPLVIRNAGTRSARDIRVHARYSTLFGVVSSGHAREDADRPQWTVIEHTIPDLHPRQSHKIAGDALIPDDRWLRAVVVEGKAQTKDGVNIKYKVGVELSAHVEFVVFSKDTEPIYHECCFELQRDSSKSR